MAVEALTERSLYPPSSLGPHRIRDYFELPPDPRCELLYGRFYVSPSPNLRHQMVVSLLWRRLHDIARKAGGLAALAPLDVLLAEHSVVQPDVLYVSAGRRGILGDRIEGTPDLVVEVLSPATARLDRGQKLRLYAEMGVREYWLVEPDARQIEFLVNREGRFQVELPTEARYRSEVLPEIHLDLAGFWGEVAASLPG